MLLSMNMNTFAPLPPFTRIEPALMIWVPNTPSCELPLKLSVLPWASWRLLMDAVWSRFTVLVPLVMQTLSVWLLGAPAGFQSEPVLQLPLPEMFHVDKVPVRVHWPKAATEYKSIIAAATKAAARIRFPAIRLLV